MSRSTPLLLVAVLLLAVAPAAAQTPAPVQVDASDQDGSTSCASTDNGTTCSSTSRTAVTAGADGVAAVEVSREDRHVAGSHDGSDGASPNHWDDHETTYEAQVTGEAAPAEASIAVTNHSRTHRQTGDTTQGYDTEGVTVEASVTAAGVTETQSVGATVTDRFAGDGFHRCEAEVTGLPTLAVDCPTGLVKDDGVPPTSPPLP